MQGRAFDAGHEKRSERVAVLGIGSARDLGISDLGRAPTILIGGIRFTVIGIINDTMRLPELLTGAVIPARTAETLWSMPPPESNIRMVVAVQPGAAAVVGEQIPRFLSPVRPDQFKSELPPNPEGLRQTVNQQLTLLFVILAAVCLIVGIVGIANTSYVSVIERTGEIGLRRAIGASRASVSAQFMIEAAVLGGLGGLVGTVFGVIAVLVTCLSLGWSAATPALLFVAGPLIGLVSGFVGGLLPALRASRLEPVDALRA